MGTKEEVLEIFNNTLKLWKDGNYPKNWRKGQAMYVLMYNAFPAIVEALKGTRFDCFNLDVRIDSFVVKVKSEIQGEEMLTEIKVEELTDVELLSLVEDIDSLHVAEDSLLRKVALQYFGSDNTMNFIRVGMLILPIIADRMRNYSPHTIK